MKTLIDLMLVLVLSVVLVQAQTRQQNQEKLVQFLAADLQMSADQVSSLRGMVKQADNKLAGYEAQYFGKPNMVAKMRKQVIMDLGKQVEGILTPGQRDRYPATKKKLYDFLQQRYQAGILKEENTEAKPREMEEATTREPN